MQPTPPFWFKQRQAKLEPAGDNIYKVTAPNQVDAFILIRPGNNGRWEAAVCQTADGPDLLTSQPEHESPWDAWQTAFELYRQAFVV